MGDSIQADSDCQRSIDIEAKLKHYRGIPILAQILDSRHVHYDVPVGFGMR